MTEVMKAAVVRANSDGYVDIVDKELGEPGYGEVKLKMEYCGLCHTDIHVASGDFGAVPGRIIGHEGVGRVVALGPGVTSRHLGERVSVAWFQSGCGDCEYCNTGNETLCRAAKNSGFSVDGGMAEEAIVAADYAVPVPDDLDPIQATSITCAGVTMYKGLKMTDPHPGEWVAIVGVGGLGNLGLQYARNVFGLHTIAIDTSDEKLASAKELGADMTLNPLRDDIVQIIKDKVGGVHAAVVSAVNKTAFDTAIETPRPMGRLVSIALPEGDMQLNIIKSVLDGIVVIGSLVGTRQDLREAFQFAAEGKAVPIVQTRPLSELNDMIDDMKAGKIIGRDVVDFSLA